MKTIVETDQILRAGKSRIAEQIKGLADSKEGFLCGIIKKVVVSERAPARNPKNEGWLEVVSGASLEGVEVVKAFSDAHDRLPVLRYSFSKEKPNKGVILHIKTATLGGAGRSWIKKA